MIASLAEGLIATMWEARRRAYALGWARPRRIDARVVSIGNLTVGGTGKTTLTLELAAQAARRGVPVAVVCKRYQPGPQGRGDEELLYAEALGEAQVFAGSSKRDLASAAARAGHRLILVDDGFSHWGLARDLDVVLLDAQDPWGGGRLIPAGRLREPRRALQRADVVIVTRVDDDDDGKRRIDEIARYAPAASMATARHTVSALRTFSGAQLVAAGAARVVTATGHPQAVEASVREAGFDATELAAYRDHHWFSDAEASREVAAAAAAGARVVLTAKDAVRWPAALRDESIGVLEVEWSWRSGGDMVERRIFEADA